MMYKEDILIDLSIRPKKKVFLNFHIKYQIHKTYFTKLCVFQNAKSYVYCPHCSQLYPGWDTENILNEHQNHKNGIDFPGILVQLDFINSDEELKLMKGIDEMKWDTSQSGRRKQNFGPKTNFKKRKLSIGKFEGFPKFSKFVQDKFKDVPLLNDFLTIEQCSLEYDPKKGASIDPHIDDCWIWGERVVTVNCLSDSVLTLNLYKGDDTKYNLKCVNDYSTDLIKEFDKNLEKYNDIVVRIPMPNRSLIVMYGPARYQWMHCVLREDIKERRVCIAYREFTKPYLMKGLEYTKGEPVLEKGQNFWEHSVIVEE